MARDGSYSMILKSDLNEPNLFSTFAWGRYDELYFNMLRDYFFLLLRVFNILLLYVFTLTSGMLTVCFFISERCGYD